jgi:hypothetical protein
MTPQVRVSLEVANPRTLRRSSRLRCRAEPIGKQNAEGRASTFVRLTNCRSESTYCVLGHASGEDGGDPTSAIAALGRLALVDASKRDRLTCQDYN